ncbi:MAG: homoserine dehydrogenase [Rickettsiales bacterium]|nr:homoserine dehydrogenase [Rickettsiales bacterium]
MDTLKIAIAGVGTVGSGLLELIDKNKNFIQTRIEKNIKVTAIARRKRQKNKNIGHETLILKNAAEFLNFDDYDVLVELIGGDEGVAKEIIFDALRKGKNVVTANKALISKHGVKMLKLANSNKCRLAFEASVAGGIPIIKIANEFLISNKIKKIYGILNGTSNYILTKMYETKSDFQKILKEAQNLGYAEADPSFDIDGTDTAHKISILSLIAFGNFLNLKSIYTEGIENVELEDINYAKMLGYKIKLLGITEKIGKKISQFVYPCLLNTQSILANVDNVYNAICIASDYNDNLFFQGQGAGSYPTASSVMSDIIGLSLVKESFFDIKLKRIKKFSSFSINNRVGSYYLRFTTEDRSGVIASISKEFKKNNISMKSMLQKDSKEKDLASIVVTTHMCQEISMKKAISKIDKIDFVKKQTKILRIENI